MSLYPIYESEMLALAAEFMAADQRVFGMLTMTSGDYRARALHYLIAKRADRQAGMGGGDVFMDNRPIGVVIA